MPRLLADVGGTNARFALQTADGTITAMQVLPCVDHPTLESAIRSYLAAQGDPLVRAAAIAIANPVDGDAIRMTNHHWAFSIEATRLALGFDTLLLLNDFTALALALPLLDEAEFFIMNFIKGPVCRGQMALDVIQDRFWVFFIDPDIGADEFTPDALDAAVADGANALNGLSFGLQDPRPRQDEARRKAVADAIAKAKVRPKVLISASAVGYYGPHGDEPLNEESKPGEDFLSRLCVDWEAEAKKAAASAEKKAAPAAEKAKKEPSEAQKKQQERMKDCNGKAEGKSGDDRKKFMSSCLKGEDGKKEPSAAQKKQQDRMKDCNAKAEGKAGDDRKKFMSSCLKG
mgnify:CR=1 FL=1